MSGVISWEMRFLLDSLCLGLLLRGIYDVFLILRKLIKHNAVLVGFEDFVFWMFCAFCVFGLMYRGNDGTLRAFAYIGFFIGMAIYHFGPSQIVVTSVVWIFNKVFYFLTKPFRLLAKALKKIFSWFKIKLSIKKWRRDCGPKKRRKKEKKKSE